MIVKNNQIINVKGEGPIAEEKHQEFHQEAALRNIAEVAIGCNDRAVVTGNTLEDEKAGFHWAYGRSGLFGSRIGVEVFTCPIKCVI
jgi:leucyl aminopeptidase (aminopeptidase T)